MSWSVIMVVISNLVMSIVEREPSGFRITVKQQCDYNASESVVNQLRGYLVGCLTGQVVSGGI